MNKAKTKEDDEEEVLRKMVKVQPVFREGSPAGHSKG